MSRRSVGALQPRGTKLSRGALVNIAVDLVMASSSLLCALPGIYFLFAPEGGFQGGYNPGWDPGFLFSRTAWDLRHTWSGVVMSIAALVHLAFHWRWVQNVTARFFLSLLSQPKAKPGLAAQQPRAEVSQ